MGIRKLIRWVVLGRADGLRARARAHARDWLWRPSSAPPTSAAAPVAPTPPPVADGFVDVLPADAIGPGEVTEASVGSQVIALCNVDGTYYALANECPHAGGPMGDGELDGHVLTCPLHGWTFDVRTGACEMSDTRVATWPVEIRDGRVLVAIER